MDILRDIFRTAVYRALSAPIFVKILGISLFVSFLFVIVLFFHINTTMKETLHRIHAERAQSLALELAARIAPMDVQTDLATIDAAVQQVMVGQADVRYVLVFSPDDTIISHGITFPQEQPWDLVVQEEDLCGACHASLEASPPAFPLIETLSNFTIDPDKFRVYQKDKGIVLEVNVPIGDGSLGYIRLGVGDRVMVSEIASLNKTILWSLLLCVVIGFGASLLLAYVLVRPISNLVQTTRKLREGDFAARAAVYSNDEIGRLAKSFNHMAESIEHYREKMEENEHIRQSLLARIVEAQEEERKSVARELHDQLGQSLSNVLMTVESSCQNCAGASERCGKIKCNITDLIDQVRTLAWKTRPSILDDYGLRHALSRYAEEMSDRLEYPVEFQSVVSEAESRLPDNVEGALYRIAQEAVTNVARHARASQVSIILMQHEHEVSLVVEDDGQGFEQSEADHREQPALGLLGMRERAALVGGECAIYSRPGDGVTIRIKVPLGGKESHGYSNHDCG